jgi:hypothetical protein
MEVRFPFIDSLTSENITPAVLAKTDEFLKLINRIYIKIYNNANDGKDQLIREFQSTEEEGKNFLALKRDYHNDKLTEFVENNNEFVRIVEYKGRLYQKIDPVYLDPDGRFVKAHFYAPRKMVFGQYFSTFWVNVAVIWFFTAGLWIILYCRWLKKSLDRMELMLKK